MLSRLPLLAAAKNAYRAVGKKWHFHSNDVLTRVRYAVGRKRFPAARRMGQRLLPTLGVIALHGPDADAGFSLPAGFSADVNALAAAVDAAFSRTNNCVFRSADEAITRRLAAGQNLPELLEDIPEMRRGEVGQIRLRQTIALPGLVAVAAALVPQVEERIYHAPVVVEKATVYRNMPSTLPEFSAILWHSDNHFEGVMKIMVYLTDVSTETAPFEYLRHKISHLPIHVAPRWPQRYPYGRVPQNTIDDYLQKGYETCKVTGPKGSVLLFDDKIIHKGNYAQHAHRDALVLQLRPSLVIGRSYIDPRWTSPL